MTITKGTQGVFIYGQGIFVPIQDAISIGKNYLSEMPANYRAFYYLGVKLYTNIQARWVAIDESGCIHTSVDKPCRDTYRGIWSADFHRNIYNQLLVADVKYTGDWTKSLERIKDE